MKRKSAEVLVNPPISSGSDDDDFKELDIQIKKAKQLIKSNSKTTELSKSKSLTLKNGTKAKARNSKSKSSTEPRRSGRTKIKSSSQLESDQQVLGESPCRTDCNESTSINDIINSKSNQATINSEFDSKEILPLDTNDEHAFEEGKDLATSKTSSSKADKPQENKKSQKSINKLTKKSKKGLALKSPNIISISDESDDEFKSTKKPFSGQIYEIFSPKKNSKTDSELLDSKDNDSKYTNGSLSDSQQLKSKVNGKQGKKVKRTPKKSKKSANQEEQGCKTPEKVPKIVDGFCPFCQMPFSALGIQSPNWHSMECMDLPLIADEECENGVKCDSTIPSHYRRYKHTVLAQYRASNTVSSKRFDDEIDLETSAPSFKSEDLSKINGESNLTKLKKSEEFENESFGILSSQSENQSKILTGEIETPLIKAKDTVADKNSDDILSCVSVDSDCLNSVSEDNFDSYGCDTESDEDIFNIATPETPNYFSCNMEVDKNQNFKPVKNIENDSKSGGFLTNDESCKSANELPPLNTTAVIDLSNEESNSRTSTSASTSTNPGITKQTSLFNFFQSNLQKPKVSANKMTFVAEEKVVTNKRKSLSALKKIKSDPWGSLKRPTKSVSTAVQETKSEKNSSDSVNQTEAILLSEIDSYSNKNGRRKYSCPFYKKIPETGFTVDAFRYGEIPGCTAYILTHFHYDHYCGLTKKFKQPIYCSQITGNLVESKLKVEVQYINRLPMNKPCAVNGVELMLREANHCPGAVIIFMRLPSGRLVLHTGDFRAHPTMEDYPELKNNKINDLYLDTTYCNPDYAFPFQQDVINFAIKIAVKTLADNPKTCIVCGTYTIGKERVFKAVASAINSKVCVKRDKKSILDCLEDEELNKMVTLNPAEATVHVLSMKLLNFNSLSEYLEKHPQFTSILVFEPTGWTHSKKTISLEHVQPKYSRNAITHYGIPYSEHSSFLELKRFVQFLKPTRIIPTVNNGNPASRRKMEDLFAGWLKETEQDTPTKSKQSSLNQWMG